MHIAWFVHYISQEEDNANAGNIVKQRVPLDSASSLTSNGGFWDQLRPSLSACSACLGCMKANGGSGSLMGFGAAAGAGRGSFTSPIGDQGMLAQVCRSCKCLGENWSEKRP